MREYKINLVEELPRMSWRRFKVLLDGLSPFGEVANHYDDEMKKQRAESERKRGTVPGDVQDFFNSIAGFQLPER